MSERPPIPRKRLGQHYLIDPNVLRKIVCLADLTREDFVCEIGPGGGALTGYLCRAAKHVLAVEVDPRMVDYLRRELVLYANLDIREEDVLRFAFDQLPASTIVVANLPYNISTPVLFRLLEARSRIRRMVLTLQLEVARRLTAEPRTKDYGILAVMAQYVADVRFGFQVSRNCFRPLPDVDSGVVRFDIRQDDQNGLENQADFQRMVRAAFRQRRKTLWNAYRSAGIPEEWLERVKPETGISLDRRAETLSVQEFRMIRKVLSGVSFI